MIDHYTSNAAGFNGGIGLTYKFSKFSNERFYVEARYVYVPKPKRYGVTVAQVHHATLQLLHRLELLSANSDRTSYIPVNFGIRF